MARSWADTLKAALPAYLRKREEEAARIKAAGPSYFQRLRREGRLPPDPEPDVIVTAKGK
jgi:hypothetical protein